VASGTNRALKFSRQERIACDGAAQGRLRGTGQERRRRIVRASGARATVGAAVRYDRGSRFSATGVAQPWTAKGLWMADDLSNAEGVKSLGESSSPGRCGSGQLGCASCTNEHDSQPRRRREGTSPGIPGLRTTERVPVRPLLRALDLPRRPNPATARSNLPGHPEQEGI